MVFKRLQYGTHDLDQRTGQVSGSRVRSSAQRSSAGGRVFSGQPTKMTARHRVLLPHQQAVHPGWWRSHLILSRPGWRANYWWTVHLPSRASWVPKILTLWSLFSCCGPPIALSQSLEKNIMKNKKKKKKKNNPKDTPPKEKKTDSFPENLKKQCWNPAVI